jgi:hypothetical protein
LENALRSRVKRWCCNESKSLECCEHESHLGASAGWVKGEDRHTLQKSSW